MHPPDNHQKHNTAGIRILIDTGSNTEHDNT